MDIKKEAVREYLEDGIPYRILKYGVSRSTLNKCVLVHQGIHNLHRTAKQISYDLHQKTLDKKSDKSTGPDLSE